MTYKDKNILVYLGYPAEVTSSPPSWMTTLLKAEAKSPYLFYLSGGGVTPQLFSALKGRAACTDIAHRLTMKLVQGYTSRLMESLLSPDIDQIVAMARESGLSTEYRILLDLWVLSRSDVYVVDCDLLGRGRSGMETVYAHDILRTVGISDSPIFDPWFQYHLDSIIKSQLCLSHLEILKHSILSTRYLPPPPPENVSTTPEE